VSSDLFYILITAVFGAVVAIVCLPLIKKAALKWGVVAVPGGRRNHKSPTPLLGGLAIALPFVLTFLVFYFWAAPENHQLSRPTSMQMLSLFLASVWMALLGTLDDTYRLDWKQKLLGQICGAAILVAGGHGIHVVTVPWIGVINFGWIGIPIFVMVILLITNAINLIDGLDGLAAGICFFAALTCSVIGYWKGDLFASVIAASVAGSLLGFLFFNFPPASIYLGDGGSLFLGFLLGTLSASGAALYPGQRPATLGMLLIPFLPFTAALLDVVVAVVRRGFTGRKLFLPDADHIHHRLMEKFEKPERVVAIFYAFSAILCVMTLVLVLDPEREPSRTAFMLIGAILLAILGGILRLYRVQDFSRALNNRPYFQFVSSYRDFMIAKINTISRFDDLIKLLESGVNDLGYDSVEVICEGNTVCFWFNPSKSHPEAPRFHEEMTFDETALTVKWVVPRHESMSYQKFLAVTWFQVVRDVGKRAESLRAMKGQTIVPMTPHALSDSEARKHSH